LLAVRILATSDEALLAKMREFQSALSDQAKAKDAALQQRLGE
jgi:phosphoribosylcarboxyaminoimidazole (NCAIR) mutase